MDLLGLFICFVFCFKDLMLFWLLCRNYARLLLSLNWFVDYFINFFFLFFKS